MLVLNMICPQCNKEFIPTHHSQKYCSKNCSNIVIKIKNLEYSKKYQRSEKGVKKIKQYNQAHGKVKSKKYRDSEKGKKKIEQYKKSDKGKLVNRLYQRKYASKRKKSDPIFKLRTLVRTRLYGFLKVKNLNKKNKTFNMVGCTPEFLKKYLEKQFHPHPDTYQPMNWYNYTTHGWHVDHIIHLESAKTLEDIEKLMHYTNLAPMWATYNIKKGNKII